MLVEMSTEWSGGNQGSRIEIRKPQSPVRSEIRDWISPALLCTTFVRWDTSSIEKKKRVVEGGKAKEEGLRVRCEFVCGPNGIHRFTRDLETGHSKVVVVKMIYRKFNTNETPSRS